MTLPRPLTALAVVIATGAVLLAVAPVREKEPGPLDKFRFVAFDGFDGKPGLNWKPVRPDESHLSYKKHPGQLTITTQKGTIHGAAETDGTTPLAKNLYVIDNPLAAGKDFVVTTCVVDFRPAAAYHQAGLILYDDDDNYLKFAYEYNWPKNGGAYCVLVTEQDGKPEHAPVDVDQDLTKVWLRLTKQGDKYDYATSTDGDRFVTHGTGEWGKGGPRKVGLVAKNGGVDAAEIDARFEFFEFKAP